MNANSYSKKGYLALKKESTANTPVQPDTFIELLDENIQTQYNIQPIDSVAGDRSQRLRSVKDKIIIEGSITVYLDANTIGYFLEGVLGNATTTTLTAATMFQHVFTPQDTLVTYTMDCKKADSDFVYRYAGVVIKKIAFSQSDNKIQATLDVVAQSSFTSARVTTDASSGTTLAVDQTKGITTDDTIIVLDKDDHSTSLKELTITTVDSELQLTTDTIDVALEDGDIVVIKKGTASYDLADNMIWIGGSDYYIGSKATNPIDNTSAIDAEDYTMEVENDVEARHSAVGVNFADRFPTNILLKSIRCGGSFTKFFETIEYMEELRNNQKIGTRMLSQDAVLDDNSAVAATATIGSGGDGTVTITATTAGRAGEDYNVTIEVASDDTLAATIDGKNITVSLANTTASKNTATLVAGVIDALTGIGAAASGTGATEFAIAAADKVNLGDVISGRDALEKESLQISFAQTKYGVFGDDVTADDIINEEVPFEAESDNNDNELCKVVLRNSISSY